MFFIPLQMLAANFIVIHSCGQRKYSRAVTYAGMGLFTCALVPAALALVNGFPCLHGENGLFVLVGIMFMIPLKFFYRMPGKGFVTIVCSSWSYTFIIFALSSKLGDNIAIPGMPVPSAALLIQTVFYILTFFAFYQLLRVRFVYVLEHAGPRESSALMWMSVMWFWAVFIFNLSFVYTEVALFQTFAFLTLAVGVLTSFHYIHLLVSSGERIQSLERIAYHDELTQMRTRLVMEVDAASLIDRKIPFHLIFFDLDDFKRINDRYGHMTGDRYLAFFAREIKLRIGNRGGFYRVAGDEFVGIFTGDGLGAFIESLSALPDVMPGSHVKFLGFSYGVADFPRDGETADILMQFADQRMYDMKRTEKRARA